MRPLPALQEPWASTINPPGWKAQRTAAIPPYSCASPMSTPGLSRHFQNQACSAQPRSLDFMNLLNLVFKCMQVQIIAIDFHKGCFLLFQRGENS